MAKVDTLEAQAIREAELRMRADGRRIPDEMFQAVVAIRESIVSLAGLGSASEVKLGGDVHKLGRFNQTLAKGPEFFAFSNGEVVEEEINGYWRLFVDNVMGFPVVWRGTLEGTIEEVSRFYVISNDERYSVDSFLEGFFWSPHLGEITFDDNRGFLDIRSTGNHPVVSSDAYHAKRTAEYQGDLSLHFTENFTEETECVWRLMFLKDKFPIFDSKFFEDMYSYNSTDVLTLQDLVKLLRVNRNFMEEHGVEPGQVLWTRTG